MILIFLPCLNCSGVVSFSWCLLFLVLLVTCDRDPLHKVQHWCQHQPGLIPNRLEPYYGGCFVQFHKRGDNSWLINVHSMHSTLKSWEIWLLSLCFSGNAFRLPAVFCFRPNVGRSEVLRILSTKNFELLALFISSLHPQQQGYSFCCPQIHPALCQWVWIEVFCDG